jgi:sulfate adenylyltransferase
MEILARHLAGPDGNVEFASAGTHGFRNQPMNPPMAAMLGTWGDATGFLSRPLTRQLVDEADLVLTAENSHRSYILDDHPTAFRKVFTLGQFAESLRSVDPTLTGRSLLHHVGDNRSAAEARFDVRDPYGRGDSAAEKAAGQIEELLRVVVPALTGTRKIEA